RRMQPIVRRVPRVATRCATAPSRPRHVRATVARIPCAAATSPVTAGGRWRRAPATAYPDELVCLALPQTQLFSIAWVDVVAHETLLEHGDRVIALTAGTKAFRLHLIHAIAVGRVCALPAVAAAIEMQIAIRGVDVAIELDDARV